MSPTRVPQPRVSQCAPILHHTAVSIRPLLIVSQVICAAESPRYLLRPACLDMSAPPNVVAAGYPRAL
eukprot:scaffold134990_cov36-Tisochrysis_lutea.AAC.4